MSLQPWEFDYLRSLVREHSGIILDPGKEYLVESRMAALVGQEPDIKNVSELIAASRSSRRMELVDKIVDAMTTNETLFFRDRAVFESIKNSVLPTLIERRSETQELSVWCAACSSGQEPYSLLMLMDAEFPELRNWKFRLLATDISPTMLNRTRRGFYSRLEVGRGMPAEYRNRYMTPSEAGWQVRENLRGLIELRALNLSGPWPALGEFDLVLLRNVLIYFDVPTKREILQKVHRHLDPDGVLLLGGGETTLGVASCFGTERAGGVVTYRPIGPEKRKAS